MSLTQDQARDRINQLVKQYGAINREKRKEITEAGVVHQFLDPLFKALNWPVNDPARFKYELTTQAGRPDMTLVPRVVGLTETARRAK